MKRLKKICLLSLILPYLLSCNGRPLFDELAENRIKVILKGTFASNSPRDWQGLTVTACDGTDDCDTSVDDLKDSNGDLDVSNDDTPSVFRMDIAELKMSRSDGGNPQSFANYRQVYEFSLNDNQDFFNGKGVPYESDDVTPDYEFRWIRVYFRKMMFDAAMKYTNGDVSKDEEWRTVFNENEVDGFDLNNLQLNTYYDTLRKESSNLNRVFPLSVRILDGLVFDPDEESTVLEIRFVVKNFVKMYEYSGEDLSGDSYLLHYWGLSDWLRNVDADEEDIGGNILAVARSYVVGKTAEISGTATSDRYVIAISSDYNIASFTLDDTDRSRPSEDCEPPDSISGANSSDIETVLDYYLQYEQNKEDYNTFVDCVEGEGDYVGNSYAHQWRTYEKNVSTHKIPPLATWSVGGTYTLKNVPIDRKYKVYISDSTPDDGDLPGTFTECDSTDTSPVKVKSSDVTVDCP